MLVQCPVCGATHRSQAKKRWHCTACGSLWDNTGRIVKDRPFKGQRPNHPPRRSKSTEKRESQPPMPPTNSSKRRFWDAEVL
jgi:hypothetical protein